MSFKLLIDGAANLFIKRIAGPFWIRRKQLSTTQWLDEQKLSDLQLKLLKRLVRHCYSTVPYYQQLMDKKGIKVEDINNLEDIKLFPILTKKEVLQAGKDLVSTKYPQWLRRTAHTGGTTGTPLQILRDLFSIGNEHAFVRRQFDWAGIGLSDRCAYLTGRLIAKPDAKNACPYAYDPFMKELILSTYHLSQRTAKEYAKVIKARGAVAIIGYPSAVYLLARTCIDAGIELKLRAALTSSETLTDSMRDTISKAFSCSVFDFYGSAERVCYIHTCERGRYHIISEYGLTELIAADVSDCRRCKLISTGFWNRAMPLIRYDLGDMVIKSDDSCPCGRAFPVIKCISGRQGDVIRTPSGKELGAAILTHLLYGTEQIIESQIIQDALDHIWIEYVPGEKFSLKDLRVFEHLITKHLPTELKVDLKQVDAVERTQSGKIKPVVSRI
jgi:phenylacetate-CoA ligase